MAAMSNNILYTMPYVIVDKEDFSIPVNRLITVFEEFYAGSVCK